MKIYERLYCMWKHEDDLDKDLDSYRRTYEAVLTLKASENQIDANFVDKLIFMIATAHTDFFFPIVYRLDPDSISDDRKLKENSALKGSREFLVKDLKDNEFDMLFLETVKEVRPADYLFPRKKQLDSEILYDIIVNYNR
ncbi:hypothetical protein [Ekhidna sp.]|jgi:hypothetical protein|uniref:hypothetical protein n=1 Tax=Ekhidna sp. TaxID=2608089 RepID=UPI0032F08D7A